MDAILHHLSSQAKLLVVSDFDGTVARFVTDPAEADLDPVARVALRKLSELPNTDVVIISGRALEDLAPKFEGLSKVRLVGSHGHEFELGVVDTISESARTILESARSLVEEAANRNPGSRIEMKPYGVAFHYRGMAQEPVDTLCSLENRLSQFNVGVLRRGNKVLEYSVVESNKGDALLKIEGQLAPTSTVFIGDDATDEAAFAMLAGRGTTIKVGPGETRAEHRLRDSEDAVCFLAALAERRQDWLASTPAAPIDQHIYLSDLRTAALIDAHGAIVWLCAPRIDSPPLFGSLVGGAGSGSFRVWAPGIPRQSYKGETFIGQTSFDSITITDFLDCSRGRTFQRAGRSDLIRRVHGHGIVHVEFAPKADFGRAVTRIYPTPLGLRIEFGQQRHVLVSPGWQWSVTREGAHDVARSSRTLDGGEAALVLHLGTGTQIDPALDLDLRERATGQFWLAWLASVNLPARHRDLLARSALVLRALSYGPTGAMVAAPTASLPETIGGIRNWDYRYCWLRDSALSASALTRLDATGPGIRLLDWILEIVFDSPDGEEFLAPLYTVTGRSAPAEAEIPEAIGYRGSRPVRIGNLAASQLQLDTLAPIAELMCKLAKKGVSLTTEHLQLADRLVSLVAARWRDHDSGIWEVRGAQRHFVHSKLMCWYTVCCCLEVARHLGADRGEWMLLRDEIRTDVEQYGWNEAKQSYVAAYDLPEADAALLWIILSGFHPPDHPRSKGTLSYVRSALYNESAVYRYHFADALRGKEGEFVLCRFWLIEALALGGARAEAERLLEEFLKRVAPLGLLAEEWDSTLHCATGNYPQAYSHLGLINAVCSLANR